MNGNEFWCRAFLSAMGAAYLDERLRDKQHQMVASYCHDAADAALEEAAQRGLVDAGTAADVSAELERIADDIDETIAESSDLHAAFRGFSAGLRSRARGVHVPVDQSRPQPELVRVAFKTATDAAPLRPAEEIALEMVVDAGWIQLGTDGVRLASDVAVPSARDILTRLIEQSRAEGAAAERRAPSTQESAPPPIPGPTARDAVAGMLLRYDFENTADMLAHGCITPTQAADIIRRPSDAGARDCIAALEALAATEPPRS